jgi:hypothetical protein
MRQPAEKISSARTSAGYYEQLNKLLDDEYKRWDDRLKLIKKIRKVEKKKEEVSARSSLVGDLDFWADAIKKRMQRADNLEKKLHDLSRKLEEKK